LSRSRLELLRFPKLAGELVRQLGEPRATRAGVADRVRALPRGLLELVQPRDGIVERVRAEQDCNRVGLAFLVQRAQVVAEHAL
jgi:hypothetical protein